MAVEFQNDHRDTVFMFVRDQPSQQLLITSLNYVRDPNKNQDKNPKETARNSESCTLFCYILQASRCSLSVSASFMFASQISRANIII